LVKNPEKIPMMTDKFLQYEDSEPQLKAGMNMSTYELKHSISMTLAVPHLFSSLPHCTIDFEEDF
jgi:hypothetical protein